MRVKWCVVLMLVAMALCGCADKSTDVDESTFDCTAGPAVSTRETSESLLVESWEDVPDHSTCMPGNYSSETLVIDFLPSVDSVTVRGVLDAEHLQIAHTFEGENSFICRIERSVVPDSIKARRMADSLRANRASEVRWAEPMRLHGTDLYIVKPHNRAYFCSTELIAMTYAVEKHTEEEVMQFAEDHCLIPVDVSGWPDSWYVDGRPVLAYMAVVSGCNTSVPDEYWWGTSVPILGIYDLTIRSVVFRLDRSVIPDGVLADDYANYMTSLVDAWVQPGEQGPPWVIPTTTWEFEPVYRDYWEYVWSPYTQQIPGRPFQDAPAGE